jgi:hypothetical protein
MRVRWAITAALAASGATAARAPAQAPFPVGTYVRTITAADRPRIPPLVGVWRIRFDTAGRVDVRKDGQLAVTGRYTLAGDTITLTDDGGPMAGRGAEATGRYRWTRTAAGLGLHVVADRDVGRRFIFGQGPLRAEFHDYLHALVRGGNGDRLMFGSDQMRWPEAIGMAIEGVASAPFLSAAQKRAIFFDNAVRFFRRTGRGAGPPGRRARRA